jgi:uncharacterized protein (TIGR02996 family)
MNEHVRFLLAISPDPRCDVHRLIYADWLEDHGHPLAELLRLQVDIAGRPEGDPAIAALHKREMEVLVEQDAANLALYRALFHEHQEAALNLENDVFALSRRDPVTPYCLGCGRADLLRRQPDDPWVLHWVFNPALAFNELVLGQRVPRVVLTCPGCEYYLVPCRACRDVHALHSWMVSYHYQDPVCPTCKAPIPTIRNRAAAAVADLGWRAARAVAALVRGRSGA